MYLSTASRRHRVAREGSSDYAVHRPTLTSAMETSREARAQLAALDLSDADGQEVRDALTGLVAEQSALAVTEARLIRQMDGRELYRPDACVSTKGWLRLHTELGPAAIKRRLQRARVLDRMPLLAQALATATITTDHVDVIARSAIPQRLDRIAEHEEILTRLAQDADPQAVTVAVKRIVEQVDPDGTKDPPSCKAEDPAGVPPAQGDERPRRGAATTTPRSQQRTPAQRWHDAVAAALAVAIEHHSGSDLDGVKTHASVFIDPATWLGRDELATIKPRLGTYGELTPEAATCSRRPMPLCVWCWGSVRGCP